jgi:hypothetical protein
MSAIGRTIARRSAAALAGAAMELQYEKRLAPRLNVPAGRGQDRDADGRDPRSARRAARGPWWGGSRVRHPDQRPLDGRGPS